MSARAIRLAERRATLVARAQAQRAELARDLSHWRDRLGWVDQGMAAVRYVADRPAYLVGAAAFVAVLKPKRVLGWLKRGFFLWRTLSALRGSLKGS